MPEHGHDHREPITFGKYLLDEELARGGMSRVFRARLQGPGGFEKKLVVKQILPELARDPEFVELFVKEANTLVQLSHPNVVPVYELGVVDGVYFLAMEWVQGATVEQLLRSGPLPAAHVAQIGAQIAEALSYAHERFTIVHRDVTPRNIIVDGAGHARLLDFGIAARAEHTGQGELFGSPGYMSPEQLNGDPLGPESDLFALGSVLYEALSGKRAWAGVRSADDFAACAKPDPVSHVDPLLDELTMALLSATRSERPQPASLVADRLRTWLAEHHPRGVATELAGRVAQAREAHTAAPLPDETQPLRESSGRIEVRSIAVNPELTDLLRHATERLERPVPQRASRPSLSTVAAAPAPPGSNRPPEQPLSDDPEAHRVARRFLRDIIMVGLAMMAAIFYARFHDAPLLAGAPATRDQPPRRPLQPPAAVVPLPPVSTPVARVQTDAVQQKPEPEPLPTTDNHVASKRGTLSVSANPWAEVRVDGRVLGNTPARSLPVRAGRHTLQLSCPPLAHQTELQIDVQPGRELRVTADMHEAPPQVKLQ